MKTRQWYSFRLETLGKISMTDERGAMYCQRVNIYGADLCYIPLGHVRLQLPFFIIIPSVWLCIVPI